MKTYLIRMSAVMSVLVATSAWAATGVAIVHGTAPNSPIAGTANFEDTPGGLEVTLSVTGLPPGEHAFHIHEFGSCDDMGKAAGSHYNPLKQPHGDVVKSGVHHAHAGDMGNITADASGAATVKKVIPGVKLADGTYTVAGRAVVIHEKVDDFSQPAGNAGGRIACAPIVVVASPSPAK